jgi:hypothetical protein
MDRVEFK